MGDPARGGKEGGGEEGELVVRVVGGLEAGGRGEVGGLDEGGRGAGVVGGAGRGGGRAKSVCWDSRLVREVMRGGGEEGREI